MKANLDDSVQSEEDREILNRTGRSPLSFNLNCTYLHYKSIYSTEMHVTLDNIQSNLLGAHWWNFADENYYYLSPA